MEKASNPIALRYWNQCLDKTSEVSRTAPEVVKVLSTAGTGINRNNEVVEARNNINRFITVDKVKKRDVERISRSQSQSRLEVTTPPVRPYNLVKEEQIKISQDRANFHNKALNLVAKSPQPFRRGLSESRAVPGERQERRPEVSSAESLRSLNDNQKAKLVQVYSHSGGTLTLHVVWQVLLDQLPSHVSDQLLADRLSGLNPSRLCSTADQIQSQVSPG